MHSIFSRVVKCAAVAAAVLGFAAEAQAKSFLDVTKKPLGYATLAGSSQWFVTWNPIPSGMQLIFR